MIIKNSWFDFLIEEKKQLIFLLIIGFLISSIMSFIALFKIFEKSKFYYYFYDKYTSIIPDKDTKKSIVIVDIDEKSLKEMGQWPWPRYKMAYLLLTLKRYRAASVGIDIVFSEPDRTSIKEIIRAYKKDYGINLNFNKIPNTLKDNDKILANVLKNGPFVLSNYIFFNEKNIERDCKYLTPLKVVSKYKLPYINKGKGFLCNIPVIASSVKFKGFFNAIMDSDGTIRRLPLIAKYNGKVYPSLALATILNLNGTDEIEIGKDFNGNYVKVKGFKIPIDEHGNVLLNVKGKQNYYKYISALDLIRGNINKKDILGKLIFIGSTAVGLNDLHNVAGNVYYPGVEVHATFADNLLNEDFFFIPSWTKYLKIFFIFLLGLLLSYILSLKRIGLSLTVLFLSIVLVLLGTYLLLVYFHIYISPIEIVISLILIFISILFINYVIEINKSLQWANMLSRIHEATIESMATVAETRDPETGAHVLRTQNYVKVLAEELSKHEKYKNNLTDNYIEILYKSAAMHDIGKVGIPDRILLKPGKLTSEEFEIMKKHTVYGRNILQNAQKKIPENIFLKTAMEIAYCHHEKWDGSGYPQKLRGEKIPLAGRLMAVADVYDALISKRTYKKAFAHETACNMIIKDKGKHFDPDIVNAFIVSKEKFEKIAEKYSDEEDD